MNTVKETLQTDGWERVIKPALEQQLSRAHTNVHAVIKEKKLDLGDVKYVEGFYDGILSVVSLIDRLEKG